MAEWSSCPAAPRRSEFSILARELRRLAELEHVDAIVAAGTGPDELVLRDVARAIPEWCSCRWCTAPAR